MLLFRPMLRASRSKNAPKERCAAGRSRRRVLVMSAKAAQNNVDIAMLRKPRGRKTSGAVYVCRIVGVEVVGEVGGVEEEAGGSRRERPAARIVFRARTLLETTFSCTWSTFNRKNGRDRSCIWVVSRCTISFRVMVGNRLMFSLSNDVHDRGHAPSNRTTETHSFILENER